MKYTYEFLRKCHGMRFKATLNNKPQEGIIKVMSDCVMLCYGDEDYGRLSTFERRDTLSFSEVTFRILPSDFEIVPRDPETYKDWQVGDVYVNNDINERCVVIFRCGELVFYKQESDGRCSSAYTCDELFENGFCLELTDVEKQILEERKKEAWKPQDGDICYAQTRRTPQRFIFIEGHRQYMLVDLTNSGYGLDTDRDWEYSYIRLASDEEKQQLFDALAKVGKRWDAEKKCLEDIPKTHEFKKGDLVLVRDKDYDLWRIMAFLEVTNIAEYPYRVTNGSYAGIYCYCVPYNEETKHLLGTTEDYKEDE